QFDCSVFDGHYVTGDITDEYLNRLEAERNDAKRVEKDADLAAEQVPLDLHNDDE
ncbi:MAG: amidophosphoribosyltransferase, partial [Gammaproteobacteria bacterium]